MLKTKVGRILGWKSGSHQMGSQGGAPCDVYSEEGGGGEEGKTAFERQETDKGDEGVGGFGEMEESEEESKGGKEKEMAGGKGDDEDDEDDEGW